MRKLGLFIVLSTIACLLVGCSNPTANAAASQPNVIMHYDGLTHPGVSTTTVYDGNVWLNNNQYGQLRLTPIRGKFQVHLKMTKNQQFVTGFVDYGTIDTPTFTNVAWNGKGSIPLSHRLRAKDGKFYDIALSGVDVEVYDSSLPLPPAKGGCDDVTISCGK